MLRNAHYKISNSGSFFMMSSTGLVTVEFDIIITLCPFQIKIDKSKTLNDLEEGSHSKQINNDCGINLRTESFYKDQSGAGNR